VGAFGKNSDGGILAHSNIGKSLENGSLNIPKDENFYREPPFLLNTLY